MKKNYSTLWLFIIPVLIAALIAFSVTLWSLLALEGQQGELSKIEAEDLHISVNFAELGERLGIIFDQSLGALKGAQSSALDEENIYIIHGRIVDALHAEHKNIVALATATDAVANEVELTQSLVHEFESFYSLLIMATDIAAIDPDTAGQYLSSAKDHYIKLMKVWYTLSHTLADHILLQNQRGAQALNDTINKIILVSSLATIAMLLLGIFSARILGRRLSVVTESLKRLMETEVTPELPEIISLRDKNKGELRDAAHAVLAFRSALIERNKVKAELIDHQIHLEGLVENRTRKLRESESGLANAQRIAHIGNWAWHINTGVSLWSDEIYRILGYEPKSIEASHETFVEAIHPDDRKQAQEAITSAIKSKNNFTIEHRIVRPDDQERFVSVSAEIMLNNEDEVVRMEGIVLDITDRKLGEIALHEAKESAVNANHAKSEFLSSMSHELRTPLNAILGFGQMLEYNPEEPLTDSQKESVGYILSGGQHLLNLINDILDLAKIEASMVELSIVEVSVNDVLNECLSLIGPMANDAGIKPIIGNGFDAEVKIRADELRFKQSLLNLMTNAIKYNSLNGGVTFDCCDTPGGMVHISVADTGAGIPEEMYEALFMPFNRLDAENSEIEGTGIGLAITKQLIEQMGGHIGVESVVGEGSVFWIELPKTEPIFTQQAVVDIKTDDGVKVLPDINGTILYVENDLANVRLMERIIPRIKGLSMIFAQNAELGIELAKSKRPDMIILDINLQGLDGYGALAKLQVMEETKDIPVIALSANAMPKDIKKGLDAGFTQYLTKPMAIDQLVNVIKGILEK